MCFSKRWQLFLNSVGSNVYHAFCIPCAHTEIFFIAVCVHGINIVWKFVFEKSTHLFERTYFYPVVLFLKRWLEGVAPQETSSG